MVDIRLRTTSTPGPGRSGKALPIVIALVAIAAVVVIASMQNSPAEPTRRTSDMTGTTTPNETTEPSPEAPDESDERANEPTADNNGGDTSEAPAPTADGPETTEVRFEDRTFDLELALDHPSRVRGLSFRREIDPDGGMIFVFKRFGRREFVMRDCFVPIDIAYVRDDGTVVNTHAMAVDRRRPGESDWAYERRLTRYRSAEPVRIVLEFAGGTLAEMGVEPGDRFEGDFDALLERAEPTPIMR